MPRADSPHLAASLISSIPEPRLARFMAWLEDNLIDCSVIVGHTGVNHLVGYWRYCGSPPCLVLDREGRTALYVAFDERESTPQPNVAEVHTYGSRGFGLVLDAVPLIVKAVQRDPSVVRAKHIAVASELSLDAEALTSMTSAEIVDTTSALDTIRLIKDADELRRIGRAYELAWTAQATVRERAVAGVEEIQLFTDALATAQVAAGEPISFVADLLSGENTASVCAPIRVAGRRRVKAGDPVIADLVVGFRGYWGDTADTVTAGPNAEVESARAELLGILESAAARLVPGARASDIFESIRADIVSTFPLGEFPHHAGHAVGLSHLADPHLIPTDQRPLAAWMVIAVEPGVYFSGWGARVEQMYVVTPSGGIDVRDALLHLDAHAPARSSRRR
jgi:Xaa-Pro dipeptidase